MCSLFVSKNVNYNNCELAVILALNYLQSDKHEFLYFSISELCYVLTNRFIDKRNKDRVLYNNIKSGINSLVKRKIINIYQSDEKEIYIIDTSKSKVRVDTTLHTFVTMELPELQTIFNTDSDINTFGLLGFFVFLIGTINNKSLSFHYSQDQMIDLFGGSKRTISSYMSELERLELIYVYRSNKRRTDGTYHNINNVYGRFKDKDKVVLSAKEYIGNIGTEDITNTIDRRSIKLRYNAFIDGGKKYINNSILVKELYKECVLYNKSLEFNPIEDKENEYKPKEKLDLSKFDTFLSDLNGDTEQINSSTFDDSEFDDLF